MSTANFVSNENGVMVLPPMEEYIDAEDWLTDLAEELEDNGYKAVEESTDTLTVYKHNLVVAHMYLNAGYYEGVQLVVQTSKKDLEEAYEGMNGWYNESVACTWYTPYHKQLLRLIKNRVTPLNVVAQFDNGETLYEEQ